MENGGASLTLHLSLSRIANDIDWLQKLVPQRSEQEEIDNDGR